MKSLQIGIVFFLLMSCTSTKKELQQEERLFTSIDAKASGISFVNTLKETQDSNYFQYLYTYIGGGVAAGDINNDGLVDLYFTSNQAEDKLYLNKGNLTFEDITEKAGITNNQGFHAGVTMADVNNDGYLDIYVSRGGWIDQDNLFENLLYINNGDSTFTEKAKEMGLADPNRAIQATFFDYDNDNDLDVYISNSPNIEGKRKIQDLRKTYDDPKNLTSKGCDKLYENDGTGHFKDVTSKAKLQFDLGFGLNPQVADLNNDGWLDVFVCNDFDYPDLAYINNKNGTFTESRNELFKHLSFNSMGSDYADINNDQLPDLITLDMNPEDYVRSKTTMTMTSVTDFESMVDNDYHFQYMHNMLQLNNGNGTFSEIGKMAGIADTDWSWAVLTADFDLDGFNDVYVTNGVYRDVLDRDVHNKTLDILRKNKRKPTKEDFLKFTKMMPQQKLHNYFFKNNGDLTFTNTSSAWVDDKPTFSNGAVYADLDNDGDLDVVVNNLNDNITLLKNQAVENTLGNFIKIQFKGPASNPFGVGVKAKIELSDGTLLSRQMIPVRGFLSSIPHSLHFGYNKELNVKKLTIEWQDGQKQEIESVENNSNFVFDYMDAVKQSIDSSKQNSTTLFTQMASELKHDDPYFNDFDIQILLPHKLSQLGPALAKADINNDGYEDLFIGGANGRAGQILMGTETGTFAAKKNEAFVRDKRYEDIGASFFDADNDGDQDLYVAHGSYEYYGYPIAMQDILYLNDGSGNFIAANNALPEIQSVGTTVAPHDYDNDGDIDLFVGGRVIPGKYPYAPESYLLENNNGIFTNVTAVIAPELKEIGMVTDAIWDDINGDKLVDLVVTGEWMGIEVFLQTASSFKKSNAYKELSQAKGWWNKILIADIDNDGDKDIIAGNLGLNYKFHASYEKPFHVYTNDYNYDNIEDIVLAKEYKGEEVPIRGKTCMTQQMPHLANKITDYQDFASRNLAGILGKELNTALHYEVTEFRSGIFKNVNNTFSFTPFENRLQISPINSILFEDINNDNNKDLIIAGNNYQSEVETTKADAGIGSVLFGNGAGMFSPQHHTISGFFTDKDVRAMTFLNKSNQKILVVANNNSTHDLFKLN